VSSVIFVNVFSFIIAKKETETQAQRAPRKERVTYLLMRRNKFPSNDYL